MLAERAANCTRQGEGRRHCTSHTLLGAAAKGEQIEKKTHREGFHEPGRTMR